MRPSVYIVLSGAKKNIGDFLITQRCSQLIRHERPDRDIRVLHSWEPLDEHLDLINSSQAIIIAGGPGYQRNMYPGIYPLTKDLRDIIVPIIPMALGWWDYPGDHLSQSSFRFSPKSLKLLTMIHDHCAYSSCRDETTQKILNSHGFKNVLMTGCAVWYDLAYLNKPFFEPRTLTNIAFTPPQNAAFFDQAMSLMKTLKAYLPASRIVCFFHRGASADNFTTRRDAQLTAKIIRTCRDYGIEHKDISCNLDHINDYAPFQIHVGYRVHGHLYFLSQHKPSFLINEDNRGIGAQISLNLPSINAFERNNFSRFLDRLRSYRSPLVTKITRRFKLDIRSTEDVPKSVLSYLSAAQDDGFRLFKDASEHMNQKYSEMQRFLKFLP